MRLRVFDWDSSTAGWRLPQVCWSATAQVDSLFEWCQLHAARAGGSFWQSVIKKRRRERRCATGKDKLKRWATRCNWAHFLGRWDVAKCIIWHIWWDAEFYSREKKKTFGRIAEWQAEALAEATVWQNWGDYHISSLWEHSSHHSFLRWQI